VPGQTLGAIISKHAWEVTRTTLCAATTPGLRNSVESFGETFHDVTHMSRGKGEKGEMGAKTSKSD